MRRFLCLLTLIFPLSVLPAQDGADTGSAAEFFPLVLVLEAAEYAADTAGAWRPDWPIELPPDAFKVHTGEISRITLTGDGVTLNFRCDSGGNLEEFPLMLNGNMVQVSLDYRDEGNRELRLTFPYTQESWKLEFLQYMNSFPSLVRASLAGAWFFISLSRGVNEITETWYDEGGNALWAYIYSLVEIGRDQRIKTIQNYSDLNTSPNTECYYDSRGLLTESLSPGGVFKVLYYREAFPRYWERRPAVNDADGTITAAKAGKFTLQWDTGGFLVRLAGETGEPGSSAGDGLVDYRYEYTLDQRGNWIERREIRMIRQFDLLVPTPGITFRRILEYR